MRRRKRPGLPAAMVLAGLAIGCGGAGRAPAPQSAAGPSSVDLGDFDDVGDQVREFMDAEDMMLTQGDYGGFATLMAPEAFWFGASASQARSGRLAVMEALRAAYPPAADGTAGFSFRTPFESVGVAPDGESAWVAEEMPATVAEGGATREIPYRVTSFVAKVGERWLVLAQHWSVGTAEPGTAAPSPAGIRERVGPGAGELVDALASALQSPAAFEAAISARADVQILVVEAIGNAEGGEAAKVLVRERFGDGGATFGIAGDVDAALAPSGSAGYVAANLDATSVVDGVRVTRPMRGLFVWLREGDAWRIVQAHLSEGLAD